MCESKNKNSELREIKCKGAGQCDHSGINCDKDNNCGEFEAITPDPIKKWPIDEAREYIYVLSKKEFKDTNFSNYIMTKLAGDFALEISNVIKNLKEKLSAVVYSNTELRFLNAELIIENKKLQNCQNCGGYEDCGTEKHSRCTDENSYENWREKNA